MDAGHYERLSPTDSMFLDLEDGNVHMHVGGLLTFDAPPAPLAASEGGLDIAAMRDHVQGMLARIPRYRQRLAQVPLLRHPVWQDDDRFNLAYHVQHHAVPRPGGREQLHELVGRQFSHKLDRARPMWEMGVIEGLAGGGFAVVPKIHHCMVDGFAGMELMSTLVSPSPKARHGADPGWTPRPAPKPGDLAWDELRRRASGSVSLLRVAASVLSHRDEVSAGVRQAAGGIADVLGQSIVSTSPTPINPSQISPHRRFSTLDTPLAAIKAIKNLADGTVNDAVLAIVAGAVRRYLSGRGTPVERINFRALIPMNTRPDAAGGPGLGNQLTLLLARLPVDEPDPRKRLARVVEESKRMKTGAQADSGRLAQRMAEVTGQSLLSQVVRLAGKVRAFNIVVTNMHGPQIPLYCLGARLRGMYPLVPLYANQGLGIALFSYDGIMCWGLNADYDAMPDLEDFVSALRTEIAELTSLAQPAGVVGHGT